MRYFCDAEFNGFGGSIISIALVPEDDAYPPFYEATFCDKPSPWIVQNVLPVLRTKQITISQLRQLFVAYLSDDPDPVLIADWPEDLAHAATLLTNGRGKRTFENGIQFVLMALSDFQSERTSELPHNAYYDALALRNHVLG